MIFTLRQLQEKWLEQNKPLTVVFIDLAKAFDMVYRRALFAILQRPGCPETLLCNQRFPRPYASHCTLQWLYLKTPSLLPVALNGGAF